MVDDRPRRSGMEPGGASGLMGHGGKEGTRSNGGAAVSTGRGRVWGLETGGGGGDKGFSSQGDDGGWQTCGARTIQMVG